MFKDLVSQIAKGDLEAMLDDRLREAGRAAAETQKAAEVTLKIKIKPHEQTGVMIVTGEVKAKLPEKPVTGSIFFAGDDGTLSRRDPRQLYAFPESEPATPAAPPLRAV